MMGEYVPKYLGMNRETAKLTIQLIRNYDRFVEQADDLLALDVAIKTDGEPRGNGVGDPTAKTAMKRERILAEIRAIDSGLMTIPSEYRDVVWAWVKDGRPLYTIEGSQYASERTWYEYKKRFIVQVAKRKGWI